MDRIVSLAPSATATVRALGAGDRLVGVTTHCDAGDLPRLGGWLTPRQDRLAELDPDLVLTNDRLQADVRDELRAAGYTVSHEEPRTLPTVLESFRSIGDAIGRPEAGRRLKRRARERVDRIDAATPDDGPIVYCEEWGDPPMAAGNWVPDAVGVAGGQYPFVDSGARSREVASGTVESAAPEYALVHHCGAGDPDPSAIDARGWSLDAQVHAMDDSLMNQPSPHLISGIERLATLVGGVDPDELPGEPLAIDA